MELAELVKIVRSYRGVSRKAPIESVARSLLPGCAGDVIAAAGEDSAAIRHGREVLLLAADGIVQDLVDKDPEWAGYCSILVNANDVAAMGGIPVAAVNVLSCGDPRIRRGIVRGMKRGSEKFGVPIVGGHLHPDAGQTSIAVAILGRTTQSRLILSTGAKAGDSIIFALDTDGEFTPGIPYSWDTTSRKSPNEVQAHLRTMHEVAPRLTAGKDISNPGALGTLGMLLEASAKGGTVDVDTIPRAPRTDLAQWLMAYQGCGFVVTCPPSSTERVCGEFRSAGLEAEVCGGVRKGRRLELRMSGQSEVLFDFSADRLGCRVR